MNKLMTTLVGATAVLSLVAFAQGSAQAQRGNGGGGFGGFAGGFGGQRGGGLMQMGLSNLPVDVLVKGLKLTDDQKTKVDDVQKKIREAQRAAFGGGNNPFGGGAGGGHHLHRGGGLGPALCVQRFTKPALKSAFSRGALQRGPVGAA